MSDTVISHEHLQSALDAVLGFDPSQAPSDPEELNERLSIGHGGLTAALSIFAHQAGKQIPRAIPLVYVLVEAANLAAPEKMKSEIKSKSFATSLAASAPEAKAAVEGVRDGALRARQPVLVDFLDRQILGEDSFAAKMSSDDRAGVYALGLGTVRTIDRLLSGAEQPVVAQKLPGRNDPCHCGSGKKFKKCHG